jgi:hypothetical protein
MLEECSPSSTRLVARPCLVEGSRTLPRNASILVLTAGSALVAQAPSARNSHVLVAGGSNDILLIGGANNATPRLVDALWSWTGTSWRAMNDLGPRSRNIPAAANAGRKRVVLFGGSLTGAPYSAQADTWEWDGARWEKRQ